LNESSRLPDRLSIDSGVILAYYLGEEIGAVARSEIFESSKKVLYHSRLCIAELFYVLCRRRGIKAANDYTHMKTARKPTNLFVGGIAEPLCCRIE